MKKRTFDEVIELDTDHENTLEHHPQLPPAKRAFASLKLKRRNGLGAGFSSTSGNAAAASLSFRRTTRPPPNVTFTEEQLLKFPPHRRMQLRVQGRVKQAAPATGTDTSLAQSEAATKATSNIAKPTANFVFELIESRPSSPPTRSSAAQLILQVLDKRQSSTNTSSTAFDIQHTPKKLQPSNKFFDFGFKDSTLRNAQQSQSSTSTPASISGMFAAGMGPEKDVWKCDCCLSENKDISMKCAACDSPRPVALPVQQTSQPLAGGMFAFGMEPKTDVWKCEDCFSEMSKSLNNCASCGCDQVSVKQSSSPEKVQPRPISQVFTGDMFAPGMGPSTDVWKCDDCFTENANTLNKCASCEASKPFSTINSQANSQVSIMQMSGMFAQNMVPSSSVWNCSVCCSENNNDLVKCASCEASKPNTIVNKTVQSPPSQGGMFAAGMAPSNDVWNCSLCSSENKNSLDICASCEAEKPQLTQAATKSFKPVFFVQGSMFLAGMKPATDVWKCEDCFGENTLSLATCASCEAKRPGSDNITEAPITTDNDELLVILKEITQSQLVSYAFDESIDSLQVPDAISNDSAVPELIRNFTIDQLATFNFTVPKISE